MARTATVNPKRGRKRRKSKRKRKRNAPKRYGAAARRSPNRRRRKNPSGAGRKSVYSYGGYRMKNPGGWLGLDEITSVAPPATLGVWAVRWALKQAGPMVADAEGNVRPDMKHWLWAYAAANIAPNLVGNFFDDPRADDYAQIGALAFAGDLLARRQLFDDSEWVNQNLYLGDDTGVESMAGFQTTTALGQAQFVDPAGNTYVQTPTGWTLAGVGQVALPEGTEAGDVVQTPDGQVFEVVEGVGDMAFDQRMDPDAQYLPSGSDHQRYPLAGGYGGANVAGHHHRRHNAGWTPAQGRGGVSGFQTTTALGLTPRRAGDSSFGYC